jgi:hypothetical protein
MAASRARSAAGSANRAAASDSREFAFAFSPSLVQMATQGWKADMLALRALADIAGTSYERNGDAMSLRRVGKVWYLRYLTEKADFPVDGNKFLGWLAKFLPQPVTSRADHDDAQAPGEAPNCIRLVTEIWHIRYGEETGQFKAGIQSFEWVAKLLARPDRLFAVADLVGDPQNTLAADAVLGSVPETDRQGIGKLRTLSPRPETANVWRMRESTCTGVWNPPLEISKSPIR